MTTKQAGMFLSRQLEQTIPRLYEKRYAQLWADEGLYLPAVGDLEMGAQSVIEETVTTIGSAAIISDRANDIPVADAVIDEAAYKAVCVSVAVDYTIPELMAAEKANRDLRGARLGAADRAMRERIHKLAVFGSSKHGMYGLFNNPNVTVVDSAYDADGGATTFDDHIDFFADNFTKVKNDTNLVEDIAVVLVPEKLRNIWAKTYQTGNGKSVLSYIFENYGAEAGGSLQRIVGINETRSDLLEANGVKAAGTNDDRVVFLPLNPDAAERKFYPMQTIEPQLMGLTYRTYMYAGTTEAIVHYPGSMLYVDIPKL